MGIQINGNTNNINAGIGSLSIEDINELDIIGVATAANFKTGVSNLHDVGLTLSGGQIDVGSSIKLGTAGVVTAASFVGSGANLTGITQTTINNNSNNRIITGSGSANTLEGEQRLTYSGSELTNANVTSNEDSAINIYKATGDNADKAILRVGYNETNSFKLWRPRASADIYVETSQSSSDIIINTNNGSAIGERLRITSTGEVNIGGNFSETSHPFNISHSTKPSLALHTGTTLRADFSATTGITSIRSYANSPFTINIGGSGETEALRITSGGDISIGGRDEALNNYAAGSTTTKLAVVKNGAGSGYHEIAHFTGGTDTNDTGAIVRITQFNNDRGLYIKGGRGTGDQAKAIFGLRNSGAADSDVMTFLQGGNVGVGLANPIAKLHTSAAYNETGAIITGGALGYNDALQVNTANGHARFTVAGNGEIYGPTAGRKNWFDNGSFDCTYGGRKANVSMDYGNHHAYGWVTDRFMSRNSVQWSRSSNVPTGKGFSYSTYTNGAGGILMQAVELPDYGDMGVFAPSSYWCVSFWSTATCNPSAAAFSYDLGSTKTDITDVAGGAYASTGETASGTSSGTFTRYYKVFQMPSSIISTATAAYWQWGFSQQGYATGWQLEKVPTSTSKPTPYEHVHPSVTIARCRRYAYRKYNSRHVCGWKRHDAGVSWDARHPVLPTHMPSGSNQSADPYGVIMHTAGLLTNFQSIWQNPAVTSLSRYGFNPADGSFILNGQSNYSGTHIVIPSYEGFEYEVQHGFF